MADHNNRDISKAAGKLYAQKCKILPVPSISGDELSSYSVILPLERTWPVDSVNFPDAPPPSLRDSTLSKQWWMESIEEDSAEHKCNPGVCHMASAPPKDIITNKHQVSI